MKIRPCMRFRSWADARAWADLHGECYGIVDGDKGAYLISEGTRIRLNPGYCLKPGLIKRFRVAAAGEPWSAEQEAYNRGYDPADDYLK